MNPRKPQRQDSLTDQLRDLVPIAEREGMYDAADWIKAHKPRCLTCRDRRYVIKHADGGGATDGVFAYEAPCPVCTLPAMIVDARRRMPCTVI